MTVDPAAPVPITPSLEETGALHEAPGDHYAGGFSSMPPVTGLSAVTSRFERLAQHGFDHLKHERFDEAATALEEAAKLASSLPAGQVKVAELYALLALTRVYGDDLPGAEEALLQGRSLTESGGTEEDALRRVEAKLLLARGKPREADQALSGLEAPAQREGPSHYLAILSEDWKAQILDGLGYVDRAAEQFERAEAVATQSPYPDLRATATLNRADSALSRGDHALGEELAREAVQLSRGEEDGALGGSSLPDSLSYGLSLLGRASRLRGGTDTNTEAILREALSLAEGGGAGRWNRSSILADLSLLKASSGALEDARALARDCEEAAQHSEEPGRIAEAHTVFAELAVIAGDVDEAQKRYRMAIELYQKMGDTDLKAQTQRALDALGKLQSG